ncbi:MAG: hypothetical protein J6J17_02275 [Bacilli bacterium]|nr:hypothetical protein [Bacilli bacterium]
MNSANKKEDVLLINLNLISSIVFILASLVSLALTFDEKGNLVKGKRYFTTKQSLNISYYNRIVILVAVLLSLYTGYKNYQSEKNDSTAKFKSGLLLSTSVLSLIGAIIILYVSYLNREEQTLTISDVENPLI